MHTRFNNNNAIYNKITIIIIIIITIIIINLATLKKSIFAAMEESKEFQLHRGEDSQGKKISSRKTRCVYSVYCSGMHAIEQWANGFQRNRIKDTQSYSTNWIVALFFFGKVMNHKSQGHFVSTHEYKQGWVFVQ